MPATCLQQHAWTTVNAAFSIDGDEFVRQKLRPSLREAWSLKEKEMLWLGV